MSNRKSSLRRMMTQRNTPLLHLLILSMLKRQLIKHQVQSLSKHLLQLRLTLCQLRLISSRLRSLSYLLNQNLPFQSKQTLNNQQKQVSSPSNRNLFLLKSLKKLLQPQLASLYQLNLMKKCKKERPKHKKRFRKNQRGRALAIIPKNHSVVVMVRLLYNSKSPQKSSSIKKTTMKKEMMIKFFSRVRLRNLILKNMSFNQPKK